MIENRTLRLGQVSRKLNVGRNTIINFLKEKGYNINSNPNAKINSEQYTLLENVFEDSAVEKKVASRLIPDRPLDAISTPPPVANELILILLNSPLGPILRSIPPERRKSVTSKTCLPKIVVVFFAFTFPKR